MSDKKKGHIQGNANDRTIKNKTEGWETNSYD